MKKKYLLLSFVLVCALAIVNTTKVNSHIVFPPAGSCGDPTTGLTCVQSGCHAGPAQPVTPQDFALNIGTNTNTTAVLDSNFKYVRNQTYYISFNVLASAYAYGFQTIALAADSTPAGTFAVTDASTTKLLAGYMGHLHASHATHSWQFKWTAPADSQQVTFYYAFNPGDSANFVNSLPGGNIFVGQVTIGYNAATTTGINNIADKLSAFEVYPNPVNNDFSLSFNLMKSGNASASVYSVDGKLCQHLFNENLAGGAFNHFYNIAALPAGIYLVNLNIDGATITKKIIKE